MLCTYFLRFFTKAEIFWYTLRRNVLEIQVRFLY